jgi:hypothetical protein
MAGGHGTLFLAACALKNSVWRLGKGQRVLCKGRLCQMVVPSRGCPLSCFLHVFVLVITLTPKRLIHRRPLEDICLPLCLPLPRPSTALPPPPVFSYRKQQPSTKHLLMTYALLYDQGMTRDRYCREMDRRRPTTVSLMSSIIFLHFRPAFNAQASGLDLPGFHSSSYIH